MCARAPFSCFPPVYLFINSYYLCYSNVLVFALSYYILFLYLRSLFVSERQRRGGFGWEGNWGRTGRSRGKGNCNQDMIYYMRKNLFSIKGGGEEHSDCGTLTCPTALARMHRAVYKALGCLLSP